MVRKDAVPQLELVEKNELFSNLPHDPFHFPAHYRYVFYALGVI